MEAAERTKRAAVRARRLALAGNVALAALAILAAFTVVHLVRVVPEDLRVYLAAASDVAGGESPYPALERWGEVQGHAYVYPPLIAFATVPLTLLSPETADLVVKALLAAGVAAILLLLGVRDWRCYLVAFLWAPVISAIGNGQVTIPLALAAALVWRYRSRAAIAGVTLGVAVAAKLLLWPLGAWLVASRRMRAATTAAVVAALFVLLPWAALGFSGIGDYPDLLQREREFAQSHSYSPFAVAEDAGASEAVGWLLALLFAAGLAALSVSATRRGEDARGFTLAIGAALACTPVIWLHYFALLLVPVAIVRPRLSPLWFVPLAMWVVSPAIGSDTPHETLIVVSLAFLTVVLAARAAPGGAKVRPATAVPAAGRP
jgi:hypothetical protein